LPDAPGVYLHKDGRGKVIYVGKAKRLAHRVRSYFQSGAEREPRTEQLVRRIRDVDYIATATETEALVLESQLIKEYRPRYNIQLRDDKFFPYLKVTLAESFPRVLVVRRLADDGARYFGPYTNVRQMRETSRFACGLFQVRTCHLDLPAQALARPCLDYQIGRCSAPCVGFEGKAAYRRRAKQLINFLAGSDRRVLKSLQDEMTRLARDYRFEEAARVRDRLQQLDRTIARSRPLPGLTSDLDVCGLARDRGDGCGVILRVRRGRIRTTHHFLFRDRLQSDGGGFQAHLLREYYPRAGDIPREILLCHEVADLASWRTWLAELRGGKVDLRLPRRGPKREAVQMARANAAFKLRERKLRAEAGPEADKRITPEDVLLQEELGLHTVPRTIECFDISSFQGHEAVGSLVFFRDGKPVKSRYRRFRVATVEGVDDYAMLAEILNRYYEKLAGQEKRPADLVVVDGGRGQLGVARRVLTQLGFHEVELIGLAKREERIHREGRPEPLTLPRTSPALRLLQRVRDEAHRFAITYHRLLRDQRTTASLLDRIPGIGRVKKLSLLHHFGSLAEIRRADAAALASVRGLNRRDVASILTFFAGEGREQ